jgi:ADP-ribose pyrophosphatase YjhB (NUDIX family)
MTLIDETELAQLNERFGPGRCWHVSVDTTSSGREYWNRKLIGKADRRGEVALAIQRPDGQVLLHTKSFYPAGVFRLLTGGIRAGEPVLSGAMREAREETGLPVTLERFVGWVQYEFRCQEQRTPFVSYVFLMQTDNRPPLPEDNTELISGFRYVPPGELLQVAEQLRSLQTDWAEWGAFRAPAHEMVADALRSAKNEGQDHH